MTEPLYDRRAWVRSIAAAALGSTLVSCGGSSAAERLVHPRRTFFVPELAWDRLIRVVVGLRPVRRSGWRVEAERYDEHVVIHNYGHGARGVGMSWGTAHLAVAEAQATGHNRCAVIGCGAVGLATARLLQRRGFDVTIYARDLPPNTTSNAAEAYFDPWPRPGDADNEVGRISHRYFQDLVGTYYGVRWIEGYGRETDEYRRDREMNGLRDLYHYEVLPPTEHPFGPFEVVRDMTMQIQPPIYLNALVRDFRLAGGTIVVREFPTLEALLSLPEPLLMNCTGLGAKELFSDDELYPVKGQYAVMLPEPRLDYHGFWVAPRDDGLLVTGAGGEPNVWSLEPNDDRTRASVDRAIAFWSQLGNGRIP